MRGLSGTRWRLWLAFLATLVLASCVEASADTTPPSVPTAVTAWAVGCKQINLAWNASTDTGGSGLGAYNVYVWQSSRSTFLKQLLATTTSGGCYPGRYTTSNTGLTASTTYYYSVAAVDKAGNASAPSVWVSAALPACVTATTVTTSTSTTLVSGDRTAPAMPTGVTASAATCSQINLTWKASTDTGGSGLRGYNVYRNGVYLKQVLTPAISSADGGLAASTVYSYAVRAVDNAGNASAMSATASSNTPGCPVSAGPWAKRFGGTSADVAQGVAVDSSGNIVVAGYFTGAVDFGRGTLTSAGSYDVFVAKYAVDGTPLWTKRLGGTGVDQARAVAVDGSGNVAVVGLFQGTANFGGASLTQGGSWTYDMFVAKYAGSDGHFLWAERFGATPSPGGFVENMPNAVAADGSGNVFVTGDFRGSITFGGATLSSSSGGWDSFVAKFAAGNGAHVWSENFYNLSADDVGKGIAADGDGNVVVTGYVDGSTINFGCGVPSGSPGLDIYVAKLAGGSGSCLWAKRFGDGYDQSGNAVAVDGSGNVVLTGYFFSTVNFGGVTTPLTGATNIQEAFVAKLSASDGSGLWSRAFPSTDYAQGYGVAVDGTGDVAVTGAFLNSINLGGGSHSSLGGEDIFVTRLNGTTGARIWDKTFGGTNYDRGMGVAADRSGNVVATGYFQNTVNLGGGLLVSAGSTDVFLASFTP